MNSKLTASSGLIQASPVILRPSIDAQPSTKETAMTWNTPKIVEIAVGLEINSYACAEV